MIQAGTVGGVVEVVLRGLRTAKLGGAKAESTPPNSTAVGIAA